MKTEQSIGSWVREQLSKSYSLKQLDLGTIAELVERAGVSASAEELHQAIAGSASMGELLDKVEKSTGLGLSDLADLASGLMGKRR